MEIVSVIHSTKNLAEGGAHPVREVLCIAPRRDSRVVLYYALRDAALRPDRARRLDDADASQANGDREHHRRPAETHGRSE